MSGDVVFDRLGQIGDALEDAATDTLIGDPGKKALHLIEPTAMGRSEMQFPAWAFGQPILHRLGFVCGVIVQDDVQVQFLGDFALDLTQKVQELFLAVFGFGGADDLARSHIQSRE